MWLLSDFFINLCKCTCQSHDIKLKAGNSFYTDIYIKVLQYGNNRDRIHYLIIK